MDAVILQAHETMAKPMPIPYLLVLIREKMKNRGTLLTTREISRCKSDVSFIHGMLLEEEDAGIVRALVGLAQGLGITVAAEGIQDSAQQASLIRTGCEQGQGQLYSDVISAEHTLDAIEADLTNLQIA